MSVDTQIRSIGARTAEGGFSAYVSPSQTVLTLAGGTVNENWGCGDKITIGGGGTAYVLSRDSDRSLTLQSAITNTGTITFTIQRSYSSISSWESDTDNDLVALDQIQKGLCYHDVGYSGADFVEYDKIVISGATTDATRYREITVAEGHRHLGLVSAGANLNGILEITEPYFKLDWLRMKGSNEYDTGTIAIDGTGLVVTLTGGSFPVSIGVAIVIDSSEKIRILSRDTPTQLTLASASARVGESGLSYAIYKHAINVIYCPGGGVSKYITINHILLHDWMCVDKFGWSDPFNGIYIFQNGGCKVFNCYIVNMFKDNSDADGGSQAGIIVSGSVSDNYVINNTLLNITCFANFMKGRYGIYGDAFTHVFNSIVMLRHFVYDQSSIPNSEEYCADFYGCAVDSDYNCEQTYLSGPTALDIAGPGESRTSFAKGQHTIHGVDCFSALSFPGHGPDSGNGFYGYGFHAKRADTSEYRFYKDNYIYQVAVGESGKIAFTNMYVYELVAGYLYINNAVYGALTELKPDGTPYVFDAPAWSDPTRTLNGTFSYNRNNNTFTLDAGGDAELSSIVEMVDGRIQFSASFIPTDWSTHPVEPSGGGYLQDITYPTLVRGFVTGPAILCVGSRHNNSFHFEITNRVLSSSIDPRLQPGSVCDSTGVDLISTFPELTYDINGVNRLWA